MCVLCICMRVVCVCVCACVRACVRVCVNPVRSKIINTQDMNNKATPSLQKITFIPTFCRARLCAVVKKGAYPV